MHSSLLPAKSEQFHHMSDQHSSMSSSIASLSDEPGLEHKSRWNQSAQLYQANEGGQRGRAGAGSPEEPWGNQGPQRTFSRLDREIAGDGFLLLFTFWHSLNFPPPPCTAFILETNKVADIF